MTGFGNAGLMIAAMAVSLVLTGAAEPAEPQKVAAGLYPTKELLLLMDEDRNGKVSRDEFMKFMAAEFDALDTDKNGELDVAELTGVRVRRSGGPSNHK
jgi:hypothetical protein